MRSKQKSSDFAVQMPSSTFNFHKLFSKTRPEKDRWAHLPHIIMIMIIVEFKKKKKKKKLARLLRWSMKNGWPCHSIKYLSHTISKFFIFFPFSFSLLSSHFLDELYAIHICVFVNWSLIFPFFLFCGAILSLNCSMIIIGFVDVFFFSAAAIVFLSPA